MEIIMVEKDTKNKEKVEGFINRKEMRKFLMENDVHSLDDVEDIISEMEKVILEEILQGEMDSHLGYSKYDYENEVYTSFLTTPIHLNSNFTIY